MTAVLRGAATNLSGVVVLLVLVDLGISQNSLLFSGAALVVALGLLVLVAIGPERMGIGLLLIGFVMAPMNAIGLGGNVTISDVFLVLGFGLLVPRMLSEGRTKLPPLYFVGSAILLTGGLVSSLLSANVTDSLIGFVKIIAAAMVLVIVLNMLRPSGKVLDAFVWSYVLGQMISAVYSVVRGGAATAGGRAVGLTTQPNFYGLAGQTAYALLIYLFYRVDPKHRWIVVGAMAVVGFSVLNSGSRASLLCCALITLMWPLIERNAITWYWILSGAVVALVSANTLLPLIGQDTVLERFQGGGSAALSDVAREGLLSQGFTLFFQHPIQGIGWAKDTILAFHNAYLEVAVGGGVLTLVGFVIVIGTLVRPLFDKGGPNRLAYAGLSYAAFGMIGPTLYDRIVWVALALILVTYTGNGEQAPEPGSLRDRADKAEAEESAAPPGSRTKIMTPRRSRSD
ncbi:MAG: hypothetical protein JWQ74_2464 [Marmoricola sp.]|nr:hypothetical protein [Marmoricola sp.]